MVESLDRHAGISAKLTESGTNQIAYSGVWGALRAVLAAAAARACPNLLMLLPQAADADIVAGDAIAFGLDRALAMPLSIGRSGKSSLTDADLAERLQVVQQLRRREPGETQPLLITAFIGSALQLVPTPKQMADSTRAFRVGDVISMDAMRGWLAGKRIRRDHGRPTPR